MAGDKEIVYDKVVSYLLNDYMGKIFQPVRLHINYIYMCN